MSKKKQIEEMAKATMKHCKIDNQCGSCHWSTCNECLAEILYNAGYRKQSEGEWVDQYQGKYDNQLYKCSECGETAFHDEKRWFLTHYCPNCGAKMKGGVQE